MRVGVICKVKNENLYNITYRNHKLYCHRNNIKYALLTPNLSLVSFLKNIDYVLYVDEHHRFLQLNRHICDIVHTKSNILYSKIDDFIDNNLIMISTNIIGQRVIKQLYDSSIQDLFYSYDITNSKETESLPHLFKLPIEKYTQYVGIRSKVFMVDTTNIETETAILLHKTLNRELGIK